MGRFCRKVAKVISEKRRYYMRVWGGGRTRVCRRDTEGVLEEGGFLQEMIKSSKCREARVIGYNGICMEEVLSSRSRGKSTFFRHTLKFR